MNRDPLSELTGALRDEFEGATATPQVSRNQLLTRLARRQKSKRRALTWLLPPLFLLGASSAWAQATGRLPSALRRVVSVVQSTVLGQPSDSGASLGSPARSPSSSRSAPDTGPSPTAEEPERPPPPSPGKTEETHPPKSTPAPPKERTSRKVWAPSAPAAEPEGGIKKTGSPPRPTPKRSERSLRLYRRAQDAHFKLEACDQAERLYAEYLTQVPSGGFRAEAAYNRGVCLIRLGRGEEARRVLEPFAQGAVSGYRQNEARALLSALDGGKPEGDD